MRDKVKKFYDIIKIRSDENEKAFNLLMKEKLYSLVGAIIRMELDSLVRAYYFNNLSSDSEKEELLDKFIAGEKSFKSDFDMVKELSEKLGWAKHIYFICCAFIHLSVYHDWANNDKIPNLTLQERQFIVTEFKEQQKAFAYCGYDPSLQLDINFGFSDLIKIAPAVFGKLKRNLECEIKE